MSEFSESYHLKSSDPQDAVALLQEAHQEGYVYPPKNGWVTFVVQDSQFEPLEAIVRSNPGVLLHYVYAEDHAWSLTLFEYAVLSSQYACSWDDELHIKADNWSLEPYVTFGLVKNAMNLQKLLNPRNFDELVKQEPYRQAAEMLNLPHYHWVSYHYAAQAKEAGDDLIYVVNKMN